MRRQRWIVRIDHLDDDELNFFGWVRIAEDDEFGMFQRPYDSTQQVISNDPPRWIVLDDYNDAQALSQDRIIRAVVDGEED